MSIIKYVLFLSLTLALSSCIVDFSDTSIIVKGIVTDEENGALPNVAIRLNNRTGSYEYETDSKGRFNFEVSTGGTGYLIFSKEGYASKAESLLLKDGDEKLLNITLKK